MPDSVSVIIPTLNEVENLKELLPLIFNQSLKPLEVIVADAGSTDGTADVAKDMGAFVVPGGRPSIGRNNGAWAATGEWLAFFDADCRPPHDLLLERALEDIQAQEVLAAISDVKPYYRPNDKGYNSSFIQAYDRWLLTQQTKAQRFWGRKMDFPVGTTQFMLTRRDVFLELGGFNIQTEPFEDSEYLLRIHRNATPQRDGQMAVGVLDPALFIFVSMRRFDKQGRLFYPYYLSFRSVILRWALGRELPMRSYWDVNERGLFSDHR